MLTVGCGIILINIAIKQWKIVYNRGDRNAKAKNDQV